MANMRYSDALLGWEGVWTFEDLNKFLLEPMLTTPGVYMETPGVSGRDRASQRDRLLAHTQ